MPDPLLKELLAPEEQLLLFLARGHLPPQARRQALALLAAPLDWDKLYRQAVEQEIFPLVYQNLSDLGFPGVPAAVRDNLRHLVTRNCLRNTLLTSELRRVLELFNHAGIAAIPLKGLPLAESLYGEAALRVCSDIDVLVPRLQVNAALGVLTAARYRSDAESGFFARLLQRHDIECALTREQGAFRYLLELHWGVFWGGRSEKFITENLWAQAYPTQILGTPAFGLGPEWQFLYLAAHAARHQWQGLKWLVDINELCLRGNLDWNKIAAIAERLGWQNILGLTLQACHRLFDTPLAPNNSPGDIPVWLKLFPAAPNGSWRSPFFATRLLKRPSEKLRHTARVIFVPTSNERSLASLPPLLSFLYYPLRPLRLGFKWSSLLLRGALARGSL